MSKIVLFGATGYTGRLTAAELVARGATPVLAGRDAAALAALAAELGGVPTAVADVGDPASVRALLGRGDVLVTTVGPFLRHGRPALDAAIDAGAHYIDSTGEGPFIRSVFERHDRAVATGSVLLSAFGFDYVPGNLAAGLALREAPDAARVEVGYFIDRPGTSGGTRASIAGMLFESGFALRGGALVDERAGARLRRFDVAGATRAGVSIPASEQLALPRSYPNLREIDVFLGVPELAGRGMQATSVLTAALGHLPPLERGLRAGVTALVRGSTGGPDAASRARTRSWVTARTFDAAGLPRATVTLAGGDPYDFTARIMAWAADAVRDDGVSGTGALGPVDAFGLDSLHAACAEAGWRPAR